MKKLNSKSRLLIGVGAVLFVLGVILWIGGLTGKFGGLNVSDFSPWGLYIVLFLFFECITAGALFFGALKRNLRLILFGIASAIVTGLAIVVDLGAPFVMWRLLFTSNVGAPMLLDVWFLLANIIFGILLAVGIKKDKAGLADIAGFFTKLFAIVLPVGTAMLFTTLPSKAGWNSTIEIAFFLVAAALAGLLLLWLLQKNDNTTRKSVFGVLCVVLVLILAELAHTLFSLFGAAEGLPMRFLLNGSYGWLYWVMLILFLVLPVLVLLNKTSVTVAVTLSFIGLAINKYLFVIKGNLLPFQNIGKDLTTPILSSSNGYLVNTYIPSLTEWIVGFGIIGLAIILFTVASLLSEQGEPPAVSITEGSTKSFA